MEKELREFWYYIVVSVMFLITATIALINSLNKIMDITVIIIAVISLYFSLIAFKHWMNAYKIYKSNKRK